jgi:hypothetical protein
MRSKLFFMVLCALPGGYLLFNLLTWNLFSRRVLADPACNAGVIA